MAIEGNTTRLPPPDRAIRERIRSSFERQGFKHHIGAELGRVGRGFCEIVVPSRAELRQQHGFFHGGLVGALVDMAGSYAAFTVIEADESMLTVEYKVNLLVPAHGDRLVAMGTVVRSGRNISTSEVAVEAVSKDARKRCAIGIVTMMKIAGRGDH